LAPSASRVNVRPSVMVLVFLLVAHTPRPPQGLFVLLFVCYHGLRDEAVAGVRLFLVFAGLPLGSLGQLLVVFPGEDADLRPAEAPEPPVGGDNLVGEEVL
jgi:hypothetical protein